MDTIIQVKPKLCLVYRDALKASMDLFKQNHWGCRVAGHGPMLTTPYEAHNWRFIPLNQDNSNIPKEAIERKDAMEKASIAIKGWVVGHELQAEREINLPFKDTEINIDWDQIFTVVVTAALALVALPLLFLGFILYSFSGDPSLIAVLDDENSTWLEVYRWYE